MMETEYATKIDKSIFKKDKGRQVTSLHGCVLTEIADSRDPIESNLA